MLHIYNSLSRKIEQFQPIKPKEVGLYTCGPTVYNYAHIGNLRTYVFEDILRRVLVYDGLKVNHVMNITDVGHLSGDQDFAEDKMEKEGGSSDEIMSLAKKFTDAFLQDIESLNIWKADTLAPATEHIPEQVELIQQLLEKGYAYQTELAIYFDISKFPNYTKLSGQKLEDKQTSRTDVVVDPNKKNPADFALWFKLAGRYKTHILKWESPWGMGFPGWHIECSAMSRKYLGQPFDIHTGGIDHIPIHHTNEIAQSEAAHGVPLANYWMHGEFLLINEGRMGKSEGNFITLKDVINKGFNPLAFRYLTLGAHYRTKLNFSWDSLQAAQNALNNLCQEISGFDEANGSAEKFEQEFEKSINDDLNMPQALAVIWDLVKDSKTSSAAKLASLFKFDQVLGLNLKEVWEAAKIIPDEVKTLAEQRELARQSKDFAKSDELRQQIEKAGYELEDNNGGYKLKKKY